MVMDELRLIYADLSKGGNGRQLPPSPIDYADDALWQRDADHLVELEEQGLAFWRDALAGAPTALDFPYDRVRPPAVPTHRGGRCLLRLDDSVVAGLRESLAIRLRPSS